jgi:two-component system, chemotaxis family, CheB/CheR fusion protein
MKATNMKSCIPVVGIGASAGGLRALEGFFAAMPANPGMAFVVITHLAPDRKSLLVEILARHAALPVEVAVEGQMVEADKVYVMPPNATLTIADGRLRLAEIPHDRHERSPIDIFFSSLARSCGEYAAGVVLSGSGADGVLGVKAIKENGGLTMAQTLDGSGPGFTGMPDSAIASGLIDFAAPVDAMAARLLENAKALEEAEAFVKEHGHLQSPLNPGDQTLTEAKTAIYAILRARTGHDFSGYKTPTFLRRIHRRMRIRRCDSLAAYLELLDKDPGEATLLFRDLLIKVTSFFRDAVAFEALKKLVIPRLFEGRDASDAVRVWVPGCATGEEVYSLAVLLREHMETLRAPPRVTIFATDIDEPTLAVARAGRYPEALLTGVSAERRRRFFTSDGHAGQIFVVAKEVRDLCVFSGHSLLRDPPFSRVDLISCRNLLIYFASEAQRQVMPILYYALQPRGYLFLGMSESIGRFSDKFMPVDKKHCVFQARDLGGPRAHMPLFAGRTQPAGLSMAVTDRRVPAGPARFRQSVEACIAEKFASPHVVVSGEGDIVYFSARTGKYLEIPPGAPTQALLTTARKGLRLDLRRMLREAIETRRSVTRQDIAIEGDDGEAERIDLTVEPFEHSGSQPLFLVVFNAREAAPATTRVAVSSDGDALLESELRDTRERLQATIEEYETALEQLKSANEELVSLNEEMQSSNEELESSKEELQSLNEELQTVNHELYAKIEDLDRANADLSNLFDSSRIATVFLDRNLVIRSFTPEVTRLFNIIAADKGRPLTDLAIKLAYPELQADIRHVLETGELFERRVRQEEIDAPYYLARFTPYRNAAQGIDGVVATFIDVTSVAKSEERQRTLVAELNHRVKNVLAVILAIAQQTLNRSASPAAFAPAFFARLQAMARAHELLSRKNWGDVAVEDLVEQALAPYLTAGHERIAMSGPSLSLPAKLALGLGMALDELATNAVKYGALSNESGRITLSWEVVKENKGPELEFAWRESGGPMVVAPAKDGFGLTLIKREIEYSLGGDASIDFAPEGMAASLKMPLKRLCGVEE